MKIHFWGICVRPSSFAFHPIWPCGCLGSPDCNFLWHLSPIQPFSVLLVQVNLEKICLPCLSASNFQNQ